MTKDEPNTLPVEDPRRVDRVRTHTPAHVLDKIDGQTATHVFRAARGGPDAIEKRIAEIDREWDVDRWFQLAFAIGQIFTARRGRLWRVVMRVQQAFMIANVAVGWAPPISVMRRLGIRTQKEIDTERAVLVELFHLLRDESQTIEVVAYEAEPTSAGTAARW